MSLLPDGKQLMSTVDMRIDYINPAPGFTDIYCTAKVISRNRTLIRTDVKVWYDNDDKDDKKSEKERGRDGRLIATGRCLYNSYKSDLELKDRTEGM